MRRIPQAVIVLTALALAMPVAATEKEARAILEKGIKAHGGAAALEKALVCKRTDTGMQSLGTRDVPFVSQVTRSLPDRVRLQIELDKKINTTLVLDGNKGWQSEGGAAATGLPPSRVRELREEAYVWWLSTLIPITRKGFKLSTVDSIKIDGEPAVGIKVIHKGHADTRLYFLERNGLLARIDRRTAEGGVQVDKEYLYGGYKEISGLTVPTKETVKVNNRKHTEFTISNYSFPGKLGAGAFARP
jgi:hypothetical protein